MSQFTLQQELLWDKVCRGILSLGAEWEQMGGAVSQTRDAFSGSWGKMESTQLSKLTTACLEERRLGFALRGGELGLTAQKKTWH